MERNFLHKAHEIALPVKNNERVLRAADAMLRILSTHYHAARCMEEQANPLFRDAKRGELIGKGLVKIIQDPQRLKVVDHHGLEIAAKEFFEIYDNLDPSAVGISQEEVDSINGYFRPYAGQQYCEVIADSFGAERQPEHTERQDITP